MLNCLADTLFLLLESVILGEMTDVLLFEFFKYGALVCLSTVHLHELFDCVVSVDHGNSVIHDLFLAELDRIKLVEGLLDCSNSGVVCNSTCIWVLRDRLAEFDS